MSGTNVKETYGRGSAQQRSVITNACDITTMTESGFSWTESIRTGKDVAYRLQLASVEIAVARRM